MHDPAPSAHPALTLKEAYGFFLPLIFMAEMMMISHSVIHAFLARLPDPTATLAAYNISFSFHVVAGSPLWTAVMTSLAFLADRASVKRLIAFHFRLAAAILLAGYLVALTPVGDFLFGSVMGAGAQVAANARQALLIFLVIPPITIFRSLAYALLMRNRRTILITVGAGLRMASLAGYLVALPYIVQGASVGAAALLLCIATETVFAVLLSYKYYLALPNQTAPPPSHGAILKFAWPLMLIQASENGVAITINFFLGRLVHPELALAAFGVADGLWKVMLGPLRNLVQTAQTLVRGKDDHHLILRFGFQVGLGFAALSAVFILPPARGWLLKTVMGLTPQLQGAVGPALYLFWMLAFALSFSAVFRGLLLNLRVTGVIAGSAFARFAVVVAVGSIAMVLPGANGALLGVSAMLAAFCAEALILGRRAYPAGER